MQLPIRNVQRARRANGSGRGVLRGPVELDAADGGHDRDHGCQDGDGDQGPSGIAHAACAGQPIT